jgi:two-component system response regulator NreC
LNAGHAVLAPESEGLIVARLRNPADEKARLLKSPKSPARPLTILIAEQHAIVRGALRALLEAQDGFRVVAEAQDGEDTLCQVRRHRPAIVLVDVAMPKLDGIEVTKRIRDSCPHTRVLALTAFEGEEYVRAALGAGAAGYVPKSALTDELIAAIRAVALGERYVHPRVAHALLELLRPHSTRRLPELSFREAEVFRLIALGYTNKEIAARLDVNVKTVDTYKLRATEKLGMKSRVDIVQFALARGWLQHESVPNAHLRAATAGCSVP